MPRMVITTTTSFTTGLSFDFNTNQMYHYGSPVNSKDLSTASILYNINRFYWVHQKEEAITSSFGHNIDIQILMKKVARNPFVTLISESH